MVPDTSHSAFLADGREIGRWSKAFAGVLALHLAVVAGAAYWRADLPAPAPPEAGIALDLAPLPSADDVAADEPAAPEKSAAVAPEKVDVPPLPVPVERVVPVEPVQPIIEPEVPLPMVAPPAPVPLQPAVAAASVAAAASAAGSGAADSGGASGSSNSAATGEHAGHRGGRRGEDAAAAWRGRVLAHLDRHKRYPPVAKKMKRQGRVRVDMTLDRHGRVLAVAVGQGAGFRALDEEALETVKRAQPLPVPPPEVVGESIPMQVPIGFSLGGV